jgi:hypothetical protein
MSPVPGPGDVEADEDAGGEVGMADVVMVPTDDETSGRLALAADESLTPESVEELAEGVPPAPEEFVHEQSSVLEVVLDEGEPFERPSDDDVEAALVSRDNTNREAATP